MRITVDYAIDRAKVMGKAPWKEPIVSSDHVILRDMVGAMELLWGYSDDEFESSRGLQAARIVYKALVAGELSPRVYVEGTAMDECPLIRRSAWPESREFQCHLESFWRSTIRYPSDCQGYEGCLPFVPRSEAASWLSQAAALAHSAPANTELAKMFDEVRGEQTFFSAANVKIPNDQVIPEHIEGVLARIPGFRGNAEELVRRALATQTLIARVLQDGSIILAEEWSEGGTSSLHYILGEFSGERDAVAVVLLGDAIDWLSKIDFSASTQAAIKIRDKQSLIEWYRNEVRKFELYSQWPSAEDRDKMIVAMDGIEDGNKRSRARNEIRPAVELGNAPRAGRPRRLS